MGMEVNGVAAASSYQSQNLQATKPVSQVSSVTSVTDKSDCVVVKNLPYILNISDVSHLHIEFCFSLA